MCVCRSNLLAATTADTTHGGTTVAAIHVVPKYILESTTRESCRRGARTCVFVCDAFKHTALRVECASYVEMTARPIDEYVGVGKRHISIAQTTRMVVLVRAGISHMGENKRHATHYRILVHT